MSPSIPAVPISDTGFCYGYGLFETLRVINGRLPLLKEHLFRLQKGARFLGIACPENAHWERLITEELSKQINPDGKLNLYLTGGDKEGMETPRCVAVFSPVLGASPRSVVLMQDPFPRSVLDQYKTLCYIRYPFLKRQLSANQEAILTDQTVILEGLTTSVFFVQKQKLIVPFSHHILPGIMRETVKGIAREMGIEISERAVHRNELYEMDEIFLTNAVSGVIEVSQTVGYAHLVSSTCTHRLKQGVEAFYDSAH